MADDFRELSAVNGPRIRAELTRTFVTALAAGAVLAALGPFGTFERLPTGLRYVYWISCILGGSMIQAPLYWLGDVAGRRYRIPAWIWVTATAIVGAAPITVLVNGLSVMLLNVTTLDSFIELYPLVLAIGLPLQFISHYMIGERAHRDAVANPQLAAQDLRAPSSSDRGGAKSQAAGSPVSPSTPVASGPVMDGPVTAGPPPAATAAFFDRLPKRLGRDLICLRMEDHYLRVHTAAGDTLILMKIGDAEQELAGLDGMRVHRSWWVARAAITGWSRDGKNLTLSLKNGLAAPVARERQAKLREAGWVS